MSAAPQVPRRTITQFCDHVCQYVRFHPDHAAIRAELAAHMEDHRAALLEAHPDMTLWEAEYRAVASMGDAEELGRELNAIHSPVLGWLQIWFFRAVVLAGVLILLFSVPRLGNVMVNLLAPPAYNGLSGLDDVLERSDPEDILADFRPEGTCTWGDYTFSVHRAVVVDWGGERTLYYLLRVEHKNPWLRCPTLQYLVRAEDDVGNRYPCYREQAWAGSSTGNSMSDISSPFVTYYDMWVSGIDPAATEITLHFDRWGENVLWLTIPLEGGEADG